MEDIRIMLAEDHQLVREAFAAFLKEQPGFKVMGLASNGKDLLELIKTNEPDVVLLDIDMPVMNGRQTLGIIQKRFPNVKAIMLSLHTEPALMNEYMACGANAYLHKNVEPETLFKAIQTVHKEGVYFNDDLSQALLAGIRKEKTVHPFFDGSPLSAKELVILKELCEGKTSKVIAEQLHISVNTVDFHRGNIYSKTKCANIAGLVKYAIKHELISVS